MQSSLETEETHFNQTTAVWKLETNQGRTNLSTQLHFQYYSRPQSLRVILLSSKAFDSTANQIIVGVGHEDVIS